MEEILTNDRRDIDPMPWYAYKGDMRRYLKELNKDKKVNPPFMVKMKQSLSNPAFFFSTLGHRIHTLPMRHVHQLLYQALPNELSSPDA